MEIIKLPYGVIAPKESDCIGIEDAPDGRFILNTSTLGNCPASDEAESESVIGGAPYDSYDEAEAAGLAIAAEQCVETVYISHRAAETEPVD